MIERVLDALLTSRHEARIRRIVVGIEEPDFRSRMRAEVNENESLAARYADADEEAAVGFFEDHGIGLDLAAETMTMHSVGS